MDVIKIKIDKKRNYIRILNKNNNYNSNMLIKRKNQIDFQVQILLLGLGFIRIEEDIHIATTTFVQ